MPDAVAVPSLNVHSSDFSPLPEYGGSEAVLYRSPDGKRVAGSFRHAGNLKLTMPYDEFIFIISGTLTVTVEGGERYEKTVGDALYLKQGMTVDMDMSDDFQDVAVLMSEQPIEY